jgi:hypothetical protein
VVHLSAGLACGFTGLAAGYAIGYVGDSVHDFSLGSIFQLAADETVVRTSIRARSKSFCNDGANTNLCGGAGALWVRCASSVCIVPGSNAESSLIIALIMNTQASASVC